jgi:hypothetical protein
MGDPRPWCRSAGRTVRPLPRPLVCDQRMRCGWVPHSPGLKVGVFRSGSWAFQNRTWSRNSRRTVPLKVRVEGMGRRHKRRGLVSWTPNIPKTRGPALYLEHRVMISLNVGAYAAHESQTLLGAPRWSNPGPDGLARRTRRRPRELWRDRPERVRDRSCEEVEARGYDLQGHRNQHSQLNRGSA